MLTALAALVLIAGLVGAAVGVVSENVDLPQWFDTDAFTLTAIVSGLAAILAMLVGGALGGAWGELYHRRADRTIVGEAARR